MQKMGKTEIIGVRLKLIAPNIDYANQMFDYTSNENVTKFLSWEPHLKLEQTENYIKQIIDENSSEKSHTWFVIEISTSKLLGVVRIFDISLPNKRCEISYIINPRFQGLGYAAESLKMLIQELFTIYNFTRIQARCTIDNEASEKVMLKIGMRFEGVLDKYWFLKNTYEDVKIYSIINPDSK